MEQMLLEILETATIAVSGFLIKKYVFLEPDMEAEKQRIYYGMSFLLIGIVFALFGKDTASLSPRPYTISEKYIYRTTF